MVHNYGCIPVDLGKKNGAKGRFFNKFRTKNMRIPHNLQNPLIHITTFGSLVP